MLRVALPNKGSLSEAASTILKEAGYRQRRDSRELVFVDPDNNIEFFYLRPRDIAVYVGSGALDVGITGRDLLLDAQAEAEEIEQLGFGGSTFRFAAPEGTFGSIEELDGARLATSYDGLLSKYLEDRGISATVVKLDGAVESSVRLGVADVIADVVSTGTTLRNAGLVPFGDPILVSEAVLIIGRGKKPAGLEVLRRRLRGVIVAREYVLMDYDVPTELLEASCKITPGLESPTVSPLADEGWSAVRALVPSKDSNKVMDELYELGAKAILVSGLHSCRI